MRWRIVVAVLAVQALGIGVAPAGAASSCRPDVLALPTLAGGEGGVMDLGPGGSVVGSSLDAEGRNTAVLWRDGRVVDLGAPRGDSEAMDVNGAGQVVGAYDHSDDPSSQRAFLWDDGELTTLPGLLEDGRGASARRINERGTIVGGAIDPSGHELPVRWRGGRLERLGPLPEPFAQGYALGVNDAEEISGMLAGDGPFSPPVPFVWSDGRFTILPALAGPATAEGPFGEANVIDGRGVAAGASDTADGMIVATVWRRGVARSLGVLPGGDFSAVLGTDGHGWYTGYASGPEGEVHAFAADGRGLRALTGLSGDPAHFSLAHAIDDRGTVGGISSDADGRDRPTVWRCAVTEAPRRAIRAARGGR